MGARSLRVILGDLLDYLRIPALNSMVDLPRSKII